MWPWKRPLLLGTHFPSTLGHDLDQIDLISLPAFLRLLSASPLLTKKMICEQRYKCILLKNSEDILPV